ncbi:SDR family oxidoreductase [Nocardioides sp. zg-579]|uniref:SDR family oxidoreductase n=1 Tax=Nocardioides marmotae TaxID=2663857 RepID=A0A6I3IXC7_9ACTN|nr:SDR family oxidoreductase [Nocardioides marmotae]MCR6030106.1 SDR family oxidoreductase [Gordonia jinghuaiqii]MTB93737.1 SDR family oxidoreductase [Nocardioides marmotae]QKE00080.1 SDR family oxidoreductase [Nocardioides marmotae]
MGRVAIVTGGASGIGQAIVRKLAQAGNAVAVLDLDADAALAEAKEVEAAGGTALGLPADVADREAVDAAVSRVAAELGRPTIVVNSAGMSLHRSFLELTTEMFEKIVRINLSGTFNVCHASLPHLLEEGWGRIINISSSSVHSGVPRMSSYVAAKAGVVGLTKTLSLEFADRGVTANAVAPGSVDTPMLRRTIGAGDIPQGFLPPVGRLGVPDDMANAVAFLASDEAGYITGQHWSINGGRSTSSW